MKVIVGNWKLNPETAQEAEQLARAVRTRRRKRVRVVLCPPSPYLSIVSQTIGRTDITLGAQNMFWEKKGAFTGEISPTMLKSLGVSHVIIGHSERRRIFGETDRMIANKVRAAREVGLTVILCAGEDIAIRRRGVTVARRFTERQVRSALALTPKRYLDRGGVLIAYEPVWAIGTGKADSPTETAEMARAIKKLLHVSYSVRSPVVLYGGSVTSKNIRNFVQLEDIDGALVGGASVRATQFNRIIAIVETLT
jgi:triosephosphate isomerase